MISLGRIYTNKWAWSRYVGPDPLLDNPEDLDEESDSFKLLHRMITAQKIVEHGVDRSFAHLHHEIDDQYQAHLFSHFGALEDHNELGSPVQNRSEWVQQRRYIAGYRQLLDLIEEGYDSFHAAREDKVLIFEGNR